MNKPKEKNKEYEYIKKQFHKAGIHLEVEKVDAYKNTHYSRAIPAKGKKETVLG